MRISILFLCFGLTALPLNAYAQRVEVSPRGVEVVTPVPHGVNCEQLRRECTHKDELGERGEGNCARYRDLCKD